MSDVTRSMEATTARAASWAARHRRTLPNGWWGMALLIATEASLFGTLLATYFYLRFRAAQWPPAGIAAPSVTWPLVLTGVLVVTGIPLWLAVRAVRAGRRGPAWLLLLGATAVQIAYLAIQIHLFTDDLSKFTPAGSAYGSIYFTLLGAHHFHVLVGILLELWLLLRLASGLTNYRVVFVQAVALYWYFVSFMAILVVAAQISPS